MTFTRKAIVAAAGRACAALGLALLLTVPACTAADGAAADYKPAVDTPVGRRVFADLAGYYAACAAGKGKSKMVPYREMVRRLSDGDAAKRQEAGEYLYAICVQTEADDRLGRTPRTRGMPLGGGPGEAAAAPQFKLIKEGKRPDVIKEALRLPWGDWKTYSSGWVRRL